MSPEEAKFKTGKNQITQLKGSVGLNVNYPRPRVEIHIYVALNSACNWFTPTELRAPGTLNTSC